MLKVATGKVIIYSNLASTLFKKKKKKLASTQQKYTSLACKVISICLKFVPLCTIKLGTTSTCQFKFHPPNVKWSHNIYIKPIDPIKQKKKKEKKEN